MTRLSGTTPLQTTFLVADSDVRERDNKEHAEEEIRLGDRHNMLAHYQLVNIIPVRSNGFVFGVRSACLYSNARLAIKVSIILMGDPFFLN